MNLIYNSAETNHDAGDRRAQTYLSHTSRKLLTLAYWPKRYLYRQSVIYTVMCVRYRSYLAKLIVLFTAFHISTYHRWLDLLQIAVWSKIYNINWPAKEIGGQMDVCKKAIRELGFDSLLYWAKYTRYCRRTAGHKFELNPLSRFDDIEV